MARGRGVLVQCIDVVFTIAQVLQNHVFSPSQSFSIPLHVITTIVAFAFIFVFHST